MFHRAVTSLGARLAAPLRGRRAGRVAVVALSLAVAVSAASFAQQASSKNDARTFFRSIVGDWIGTCEQSTDGEQADNKYFQATVREVNPNSFNTRFEYYRLDKSTGKPLRIGDANVATTIGSDGVAKSKIVGSGTVLVEEKPKPQKHELIETLSSTRPGTLTGTGTGTVSVSGMPLGLGKNGKVKGSKSVWSLNNGTLQIDQKLNIGFRAFVFNKNFTIQANYTAKRGTDIASLMNKNVRVSAKPGSSTTSRTK